MHEVGRRMRPYKNADWFQAISHCAAAEITRLRRAAVGGPISSPVPSSPRSRSVGAELTGVEPSVVDGPTEEPGRAISQGDRIPSATPHRDPSPIAVDAEVPPPGADADANKVKEVAAVYSPSAASVFKRPRSPDVEEIPWVRVSVFPILSSIW